MSIYQKRSKGQIMNLLESDDGGSSSSDYDFIMTVGKPATDGYYGYSADNYGNVDPKIWGNSDTSEISLALVRPSTPYFYFRATEAIKWNDYDNVKLRFFTETDSVETTVSNGFLFTEIRPEYAWNEEQPEVAAFLRSNYDNDVSVKVIDASLDVINTIEMTIGLYGSSSFNAWGYRSVTAEVGEIISGEYHSGSVIETCYARDYYYGMILQSSVENEYWDGWDYVTATWEFEGGESHVYAGRLLMHPDQGFYCSGVIDDELNALAQNNIDKTVTITLSQAEIPSNVIEIEIGEVAIDAADDIAYGLRVKSETGELISGEFPDGSPIVGAYVRTDGYGCLIGGAFERSYWNYLGAINVTWEFEDETSYEFPEPLEYYYNSTTKESYYKSDYIDEALIEMIASKVGQTVKITVTESETSKLLAHLRWGLDEEAKS
ncbi:hypothetical protein P3499_04255 [Vibrio parahaemolyticus]|nr:hypothetical protein [Vibrio parahaemolyticus]